MEKFTNFGSEVWCEKNSFGCCKGELSHLDESFVSHDTKLFKRIKSSLSDRESKDESF